MFTLKKRGVKLHKTLVWCTDSSDRVSVKKDRVSGDACNVVQNVLNCQQTSLQEDNALPV